MRSAMRGRFIAFNRFGGDRFRFNHTVHFQGIRKTGADDWVWHTTIALVGPEWNDGNWLGGMSWKRHGPFAVCRRRLGLPARIRTGNRATNRVDQESIRPTLIGVSGLR